jgi:hypothetical protein
LAVAKTSKEAGETEDSKKSESSGKFATHITFPKASLKVISISSGEETLVFFLSPFMDLDNFNFTLSSDENLPIPCIYWVAA